MPAAVRGSATNASAPRPRNSSAAGRQFAPARRRASRACPRASSCPLLANDSGSLTAAELAERLHASPAAISGAVRYLAQVGLVGREREPGSRRDRYHVYDNAWYEAIARRERLLLRWEESAREGVEALGADSAAGARMAETLAFFEFLRREMPAVLERWRDERDARSA